MEGLESWMAGGSRVQVDGGQGPVKLWYRVEGNGPWTTFMHGFPTSSWDWAKVLPLLPAGHSRLFLDHLGFGDSDKPRRAYSFDEQLELLLQLWARLGVQRTVLVVHDYSVSIAQEILARQQEGRWSGPTIAGILMLNGGLYADLYQAMPIQKLLHNRVLGPVVSRLIQRRTFDRAFNKVFAAHSQPTSDELAQHWASIENRQGRRVYHLISRYHDQRAANAKRWAQALRLAQPPMRFGWGVQDPVSVAAIADRIEAEVPGHLVRWDVGHYPHLEVPEQVAAEVAQIERLG